MSRFPTPPDQRPGPPPEVADALVRAWERAQVPIAGELYLRFVHDPDTRRVSGELHTLGGEVCLRLSAAEALALACGDASIDAAG